MARLPRLTAPEAERRLLAAGFQLVRSKGNHRIFARANERTVIPFHRGKMLHPRLVREVLLATGEM